MTILNDNIRYVAIDFETTGLDKKKDEPIQVGLVVCDASGNLVDAFVSHIAPTKKISNLKDNVSVITGLSLKDLEHAPEREEVYESLKNYIDENTVLIGHNISFDYFFLQKYWPTCTIAGMVDTFVLSQALLHFHKSYALESIKQTLLRDDDFVKIYENLKSAVGQYSVMKAHDALYDSVQAMSVFFHITQRYQTLEQKYPQLQKLLLQSQGTYAHVRKGSSLQKFQRISQQKQQEESRIAFPLMEKVISNAKPVQRIQKDLHTLGSQGGPLAQSVCIGHSNLKDFLRYCGQEKVVLAFSHRSKIDIARNMLKDLGHVHIDFLKDDQYIQPQFLKSWLNKGNFSSQEFLFACKYLSQYDKGYSVLDLKTKTDRAIMTSLQKPSSFNPQGVVLCSHGGLYALLQHKLALDTQWLQDYTIVFCDPEWWYTSYNKFANAPFDLYSLLDIVEQYAYKYRIHHQTMGGIANKKITENLETISTSLAMYIPILYSEITQSFIKQSQSSVVMQPMLHATQFYKSSMIRERLYEQFLHMVSLLEPREQKRLTSYMQRFNHLVQTMVKVERKLGNDGIYFTFSDEVTFTDFSEFVYQFRDYSFLLASHKEKQGYVLSLPKNPSHEKGSTKIAMKIPDYDITKTLKALQNIQKGQKIFVVSNKKHITKKLFSLLFKQGIHKQCELLVENFTGGIAKNTMKAGQPGTQILIGGYHFLLNIYAHRHSVDQVINLCIDGPLADVILQDIQRYSNGV